MGLQAWLAFVAASTLVLAVPGPVAALAASYAMNPGRPRAWAIVPGTMLGDLMAMTVSFLGIGAVVAHSPTLFIVLKLVGAVFLIWLGTNMIVAATKREIPREGVQDANVGAAQIFWGGFVVTAVHPGSLVFFVSFVPQFLDPFRSTTSQFLIFLMTFLILAAMTTTLWVVLADGARLMLSGHKSQMVIKRTSGAFLVAIGMFSVGLAVVTVLTY